MQLKLNRCLRVEQSTFNRVSAIKQHLEKVKYGVIGLCENEGAVEWKDYALIKVILGKCPFRLVRRN